MKKFNNKILDEYHLKQGNELNWHANHEMT